LRLSKSFLPKCYQLESYKLNLFYFSEGKYSDCVSVLLISFRVFSRILYHFCNVFIGHTTQHSPITEINYFQSNKYGTFVCLRFKLVNSLSCFCYIIDTCSESKCTHEIFMHSMSKRSSDILFHKV
jgi:hypothetical protein